MRFLLATLAAVVLTGTSVSADDQPSAAATVENTDLGRVFMSPAERRVLDRLRNELPPQAAAQGSQPTSQSAPPDSADKTTHPAGYIVPSSGAPYKWINGDFQKTTQSNIKSEGLPGSVRIIRHKKRALTDAERESSSVDHKGVKTGLDTVSDAETRHDEND